MTKEEVKEINETRTQNMVDRERKGHQRRKKHFNNMKETWPYEKKEAPGKRRKGRRTWRMKMKKRTERKQETVKEV